MAVRHCDVGLHVHVSLIINKKCCAHPLSQTFFYNLVARFKSKHKKPTLYRLVGGGGGGLDTDMK